MAEKECKKCSKTSSYKHIGVIVLGTYVLFACFTTSFCHIYMYVK